MEQQAAAIRKTPTGSFLTMTAPSMYSSFSSKKIQNVAATSQIASPAVKRVMRVAVLLIELVTYVVICWYGVVWVMRSNAHMQSIPWMKVRHVYLAIPVSAFFMAVFAVKQLGETVTGKGDDTETRE